MEIIFQLDKVSKELVLSNELVRLFNKHFDELVLDYVSVYRGPRFKTLLGVLIGVEACTSAVSVGIHHNRLVYALQISNINAFHMFNVHSRSNLLPIAISAERQGKIRDSRDINSWHSIPPMSLTGRLESI